MPALRPLTLFPLNLGPRKQIRQTVVNMRREKGKKAVIGKRLSLCPKVDFFVHSGNLLARNRLNYKSTPHRYPIFFSFFPATTSIQLRISYSS